MLVIQGSFERCARAWRAAASVAGAMMPAHVVELLRQPAEDSSQERWPLKAGEVADVLSEAYEAAEVENDWDGPRCRGLDLAIGGGGWEIVWATDGHTVKLSQRWDGNREMPPYWAAVLSCHPQQETPYNGQCAGVEQERRCYRVDAWSKSLTGGWSKFLCRACGQGCREQREHKDHLGRTCVSVPVLRRPSYVHWPDWLDYDDAYAALERLPIGADERIAAVKCVSAGGHIVATVQGPDGWIRHVSIRDARRGIAADVIGWWGEEDPVPRCGPDYHFASKGPIPQSC